MSLGVLLAKRYLALAPAYPPRIWTEPKPLERAQMEYDDECAGGFLRWFPGLDLRGKDLFDIGCGYGGRPVRYAELGARSVTGLEIADRAVNEARAFAESRNLAASFVTGSGESLPFPDDSFDLITSYDVFEHVCNIEACVRECLRVLRPGGKLYAVFPPFYHPTGSHLEGWLSLMPWANLLFRSKTLIKAGYEILESRRDSFRPTPLRPSDKLWVLNGATIRSTRKMLDRIECDYSLKCAPLFSPLNSKWERWHMKYYGWSVGFMRHVPLVNECFTHRIVLTVTCTEPQRESSLAR